MNSDLTQYQKIKRQCICCGDCASAKFMFWKESDMVDEPPTANSERSLGLSYVVRCDYFRIAVYSPHALEKCEARKSKGGEAET